jgi:hypothetical protein
MPKKTHATAALTPEERRDRRWQRQEKERIALGIPLERDFSDRAPRRRLNASPDNINPYLARYVEARLADGLGILAAWAVDRSEAAEYLRQIRDPLPALDRLSLRVDARGSPLAEAVEWIEYLWLDETVEREALPNNVAAILYWRLVAGLSWRRIADRVGGQGVGEPGTSHVSCRKHFNRSISIICAVFREKIEKQLTAFPKSGIFDATLGVARATRD